MTSKIWTKVPDFLSKSVLKKVFEFKICTGDELGYALRSGQGNALEKLQKGAQLLADLHRF